MTVASPFKGVGRNDPCPCGSGRKFKKCCLAEFESAIGHGTGAMRAYDPLIEPSPADWLALDEQVRIDLVEAYHRRAGIHVPRATLHAIMHAIVENQIALGDQLPVRRTAERLMAEGLDRHDAIHAIGSVLAVHLNNITREVTSDAKPNKRDLNRDPNDAYFTELERLTAEQWLRS
jgi:hypothetical protein